MHFAACALVGESMTAPSLYYRTNVVGSLNLLEAARLLDIHNFVFSSTCATYGIPDEVPIPEESPQRPINPYGASKLMIERMLVDYEMAYGIRHATLRYFNAAGADPDGEIGETRLTETHLIPLMLDAILGRRPPLQIFGTDYPTLDGTAVRDYIHVADLATAHLKALEYLLREQKSVACNLGTGVGYSVQQVINAAHAVTGHEVPHSFAPRRSGDPFMLVAQSRRAAEVLGLEMPNSMDIKRIIADAWAWHSRGASNYAPALVLSGLAPARLGNTAALGIGPSLMDGVDGNAVHRVRVTDGSGAA